MISFKNYFLLSESPITWAGGAPIPVVELGLDNTGALPPEKPYGFWVDKSGNFKAVYNSGKNNTGGHAGAAKSIISLAIDYKDSHGGMTRDEEDRLVKALTSFSGVYNVLEISGFMHVVLGGNTYYYKVADAMPSSQQKKFLAKLTTEYGTETEYASEIF